MRILATGAVGMIAGIKVVHHTQKVSQWHNRWIPHITVPQICFDDCQIYRLPDLAVSEFGKRISRSGIKHRITPPYTGIIPDRSIRRSSDESRPN
jgi:hypothetical protein